MRTQLMHMYGTAVIIQCRIFANAPRQHSPPPPHSSDISHITRNWPQVTFFLLRNVHTVYDDMNRYIYCTVLLVYQVLAAKAWYPYVHVVY
jgi:hypothetical protein